VGRVELVFSVLPLGQDAKLLIISHVPTEIKRWLSRQEEVKRLFVMAVAREHVVCIQGYPLNTLTQNEDFKLRRTNNLGT